MGVVLSFLPSKPRRALNNDRLLINDIPYAFTVGCG